MPDFLLLEGRRNWQLGEIGLYFIPIFLKSLKSQVLKFWWVKTVQKPSDHLNSLSLSERKNDLVCVLCGFNLNVTSPFHGKRRFLEKFEGSRPFSKISRLKEQDRLLNIFVKSARYSFNIILSHLFLVRLVNLQYQWKIPAI